MTDEEYKKMITERAGSIGRISGVIAAGATLANVVVPPQYRPITEGIGRGAGYIGAASAGVEVAVTKSGGKIAAADIGLTAVQNVIDNKIPVAAPVTNEIKEKIAGSGFITGISNQIDEIGRKTKDLFDNSIKPIFNPEARRVAEKNRDAEVQELLRGGRNREAAERRGQWW